MNVSLSLTVPEGWIEGFIETSDLFRYNAIGYWAVGFRHGARKGWIVVDNEGDKVTRAQVRDDDLCEQIEGVRWGDSAAVAALLDVDPKHVHWLAAGKDGAKVYAQAVRLYGEREAASVDASQLDTAVQYALGVTERGKAKYG